MLKNKLHKSIMLKKTDQAEEAAKIRSNELM